MQYGCRSHDESASFVHDLECLMWESLMEETGYSLVHKQHCENWIQNLQESVSFHGVRVSSVCESNARSEAQMTVRPRALIYRPRDVWLESSRFMVCRRKGSGRS
jgi:hypothetical protein